MALGHPGGWLDDDHQVAVAAVARASAELVRLRFAGILDAEVVVASEPKLK